MLLKLQYNSMAALAGFCRGAEILISLQADPGDGGADRQGHRAPPSWHRLPRLQCPADYKFGVSTSGKKRLVTPKIKRELHRGSAVEPAIGHLKSENRMEHNYLLALRGDATNAVLAGVGYNFRSLIR